MRNFLFLVLGIISITMYSCGKDTNNAVTNTSGLPSSPTSLTGSLISGSIVSLSWLDNSNNETGFEIERKTGIGNYSVIGSVKANSTNYNDSTLAPNTTYTYKVLAYNSTGSSTAFTNEVTITSGPVGSGKDSLYVSLSTYTVENNGWDMVQITVKDTSGNNVTSSCNLSFNSLHTDSIFYPSATGTFTVTATKGFNFGSTKLVVTTPSAAAFTRKLLIEDFSGTWCGYCPRMGYELDQYTSSQPKAVWITVHGGVGSGDPYVFQYESNLEPIYNVTGFPTGIVNGYLTWDENNSTLDNEYKKWTPLGLAVQSTTSGSTITGTAQVKFNVNTNKPLKVVVALIESNLLHSQDNYYSSIGGVQYSTSMPYLYGGADPVINFNEKNVLRSTSTNYLGDAIPVSAEYKGNIYSVPFTFSTSGVTGDGTSFTVVPANCKVVAYVVDANGTFLASNTLGVINVQQAAVGKTQPFD